MEIKKARTYVEDIIDICSQLEDESLNETTSGIYNDIQVAKSVNSVISSARELMVFVNESYWDDAGLPDLRNEIEIIFEKLLEDSEEL